MGAAQLRRTETEGPKPAEDNNNNALPASSEIFAGGKACDSCSQANEYNCRE